MNDDLNRRIALLEEEIGQKNALIAKLYRAKFVPILFGSFLHETTNIISMLSMDLINFEEAERSGNTRFQERAKPLLKRLRFGIQKLQDVTEELTYITRYEDITLSHCIQKSAILLDKMLSDNQIELDIKLDGAADLVRVPRFEFEIVITNILLNAIQALQAIDKMNKKVTIETSNEKGFIKLLISDNGQGIRSELRDKIWNAGFTTRRGLTGLGLSIVREIVLGLGGTITIESELGQMTQFAVFVPNYLEMKE